MTTETAQELVSELGIDLADEAKGVTQTCKASKQERENRASWTEALFYRIFCHEHPRLHDALAIWLLINEGWRRGIVFKSYELVFRRSIAPDHQTVEEMIASREITICAGHGPFSKVPRVTDDESVTKNVARFLGILDDTVYAALIEWSHNVEAKGPGSWRETAGMLREVSLANLDDSAGFYHMAEMIFDSRRAVITEELRAEKDLEEGLETMTVFHKGRSLVVGGIHSDAQMIARVSRRPEFNVDVLIRVSTSGHVLITSRNGIDLSSSVAYLRKKEAELAGEQIPNDLTAAREVGRWVYKPERMQSIINGGFTAPEMLPTAIDLKDLMRLVVHGLAGI